MGRHSRNNTARGFFTYAERQMMDYGTKKQRLGTASKRNFDACFLCLQTARHPLTCSEGHLACKECFYEHVLIQMQEIARQKRRYQQQQEKQTKERRQRDSEAKEVQVHEFTTMETGLLNHFTRTTATTVPSKRPRGEETVGNSTYEGTLVETRKQGQLPVTTARTKSSTESMSLLSFWLPSLAPEAEESAVVIDKLHTTCTAVDPPHRISLKKLVEVYFSVPTTAASDSTHPTAMCPSCRKSLNNGVKLALPKACGHVHCQHCMTKFVIPSQACSVCSKKCNSTDVIALHNDGTGYTGSGTAVEAKRYDVTIG
ncbi:hypothetical protein IWQ61_009615 [Dispira simplex]|nr:hypothetical protein IWQ61_009615 [Dispira simplex]